MGDQRFRPEYHIRRHADFQRAYARRCRAGDGLLLVFGCYNDLPHPRLGLSVSRKIGGAVVRNRWKRLLREAFRTTRLRLPEGVDLVVIPRPGVEPQLLPLQDSLVRLAQQVSQRLGRERLGRDRRRERRSLGATSNPK